MTYQDRGDQNEITKPPQSEAQNNRSAFFAAWLNIPTFTDARTNSWTWGTFL